MSCLDPKYPTSDIPFRVVEYALDGDVYHVIADVNGHTIATLDEISEEQRRTALGNSFLFAAAPDMRRVLTSLLKLLEGKPLLLNEEQTRLIRSAVFALAKANGHDTAMLFAGEGHDGGGFTPPSQREN